MEQLYSLVEYGSRRAFITLTAIICTLLSAINTSAVNVAFPDIKGNLGISLDQATWLLTAYTLGMIVIVPFSNSLSGQLGRRNYFFITTIFFTTCSFFCGNATGISELVIFRFLQGIGSGGMLVLSHTVITESWPVEKRAISQAFVILGIFAGRGFADSFGGYMTDNYSWPYIFFANIPIGIISCVLILIFVRNTSYKKKEDWIGNMMLAVGAAAMYCGLERGAHNDEFNNPLIIVLLLLGLTGISLYVWRQIRFTSPLGSVGLLQNNNVRIGVTLTFITVLGGAGASTLIMSSLGRPAVYWSEIPLWPPTIILIVILIVTAILIENITILKYTIATGLLLLLICSFMPSQIESVDMLWVLLICVMAIILLSLSISTLLLSKLEGKEIGQGVALYNIVQLLGIAISIALFSI
jgi:DHA2 family multidrug resistance protein